MGLFDRLFKKKSSSQPLNGKDSKSLAKNSSLPNLNKTDPNLKSLGQVTEQVESDEEQTNISSTFLTKNQSTNESNGTRLKTDYESSSQSSSKSKNDLDFLNTLTGTNKSNQDHEPDSKSITSVSSQSAMPIKPSLKKDASNKNLADRIIESNKKKDDTKGQNSIENLFRTNSSTNQSVTFREPASEVLKVNDKTDKRKKLEQKVENLEKQILERDEIIKNNTDNMIIKFHDNVSKNINSDSEKQELIRALISKQQESNEKLINDQKKIIDLLNTKCKNYEKEIKNLKKNHINDALNGQVNFLEEENLKLKEYIRRQNSELNYYYSNYSKLNKSDTESKLSDEKNKWKNSISQLTPLFLIYDQKLEDKEEAMKLMRIKIDEITDKFNLLIEENQNLHSKLQNLPDHIKNQLVQIKSQAELVLEENKFLSEKLSIEEKKVYNSEKFKIEEMSRLSKRILNCEVERIDLMNKIDVLESNNQELIRKFNETSIEMQRRVKLEDHLTQIGNLKRKMEELNLNHKNESELLILKVKAYEDEKKNLIVKITDSEANHKRLMAENMVLDEALNKGIGHRAQKKLKDIQKSLEIAKINESKLIKRLEHLEKELEKIKFENKSLENLLESSEANLWEKEKKVEELIAKNAQIEEVLNEFKDKASLKLANLMEKLKRKDSELKNYKLDNEKKLNRILKNSVRRQKTGDEIKENEQFIDNKFVKEILFELKS